MKICLIIKKDSSKTTNEDVNVKCNIKVNTFKKNEEKDKKAAVLTGRPIKKSLFDELLNLANLSYR